MATSDNQNRWSRVAAAKDSRQPPSSSTSRDRTSTTQHRPQQSSSSTPKPNAWGAGRSGTPSSSNGAPTTTSIASSTTATSTAPPATTTAPEEKYTPIGGFNAEEVKEAMRKTYQDALAGDTDKTARYKASDEGSTPKPAAWAQKPSNMANGADFWVQLRKQIAGLEKGG